ncbi:MAG: c-type cytochrome, partial [Planctomycetes bacterium]|nr:c-type cytochrome [Planctomycetota bacterium]
SRTLLILAMYRLGPPDEATRHHLMERLGKMYPAGDREANVLLTELLCYLQAPIAAEKGINLLTAALTQEEQLDIARSLRFLKVGWTLQTRREFFEWLLRAQAYRGGVNFTTFIDEIKADALKGMTDRELHALKDVIDAPIPTQVSTDSIKARSVVKEWTKDEVLSLLDERLQHRDFEHGKAMFAAANCFKCHRFDGEGGVVGPDLTLLSGRFSARDILESVMDPDKVISDQYAAVTVITTNGKAITGRIVNFGRNAIDINTDMLDPTAVETVNPSDVDELETATVSMMPSGLLNTLNETELLDLFAFLLSRGDRHHAMFDP